jgi:catechol 2,3-dioxygenase-like lactoylglutathione lyase family enzyme
MNKNLVLSVPMLHVSEMTVALEFYRDRLGFSVTSEYRPHQDSPDAYVVLQRDDAKLHLSSFSGDGKPGGVAVVFVQDVDALYEEFRQKGVAGAPCDQTWGNREMYIRDADGNQLRYTQPRTQ